MVTRREFIRTAALFALAPHVFADREKEIWVNDVHSQLNRTRVRDLLTPHTRNELAEIVRSASRKGLPISVSGCRHSMGGQQFATDSICIDTAIFNFQSMKNRRTSFTAACFPATNQSTKTNRSLPKKNHAMMTGWTSCASLTPIEKRLSSATAITICRPNGQTYWSDTSQLSAYLPNYAAEDSRANRG